jgi:predicted dehydrogenase
MPSTTRRTFLKSAALGASALALPRTLRAAESANEKVRFALIGCGIRGSAFVDQSRLDAAAKSAGVASTDAVNDLRRVLDRKDIDAVVIATPDHWHAPAAILAGQAGKHVYVEKPCSHNFRESQLLVEAARKHNVVVQHGTQQRSR